MNTIKRLLVLLIALELLACSYPAPENTGYISSVAVYGNSPNWAENYYNGVNSNWYAGTPDYLSPSFYSTDF